MLTIILFSSQYQLSKPEIVKHVHVKRNNNLSFSHSDHQTIELDDSDDDIYTEYEKRMNRKTKLRSCQMPQNQCVIC